LQLAGTGDLDTALDVLSRLVSIVVINVREQGAIANAAKTAFMLASLSVQPVDTVGAGDSFNAGSAQFIRGADNSGLPLNGNAERRLSQPAPAARKAFSRPPAP